MLLATGLVVQTEQCVRSVCWSACLCSDESVFTRMVLCRAELPPCYVEYDAVAASLRTIIASDMAQCGRVYGAVKHAGSAAGRVCEMAARVLLSLIDVVVELVYIGVFRAPPYCSQPARHSWRPTHNRLGRCYARPVACRICCPSIVKSHEPIKMGKKRFNGCWVIVGY